MIFRGTSASNCSRSVELCRIQLHGLSIFSCLVRPEWGCLVAAAPTGSHLGIRCYPRLPVHEHSYMLRPEPWRR